MPKGVRGTNTSVFHKKTKDIYTILDYMSIDNILTNTL